MTEVNLNWIANFIWGIADDVLRDVYVRGKYRDVILPMTVIRRLDAQLEATKPAVLQHKARLDGMGVANQESLKTFSKHPFYNSSPFTLPGLLQFNRSQQLRDNFEAYLDGFSPNVQEILNKFKFRNQIQTLVDADVLGSLLVKFTDHRVNLSPRPVLSAAGEVVLPGLDNHGMGTIFEELIRRFNDASNEEAGEHWTPRDVVGLMADLILLPIRDEIDDGTYLLYDGACGTGGMLTVAEERLRHLAREHGKDVSVHLFGQEINPETYAITKADLLLRGEEADNIAFGSTLSADGWSHRRFDFMLSNPPYGKNWKTDLERLGSKGNLTDPRFVIQHADAPEYSLMTRSSDGQLMFLANKIHKMRHDTRLGSRIAEVHNGSSLFTGDAGQGDSNIRRWIIESDWLEAIIALPLNMFYNTGIATYVWVLTNRKSERRRGTVQLIDATKWFRPLRKNQGQKNCEFGPDDVERVMNTFMDMPESEQSRIFPNATFGYWKVTVERPLRLAVDLGDAALARFRADCERANEPTLPPLLDAVAQTLGAGPHLDYNAFVQHVQGHAVKMTAKRLKLIQAALCQRDPAAAPVVRKTHRNADADPLHGLYEVQQDRATTVVEYEPDADLRDTEQIPLLEAGGIPAFIAREVLPHVPDAWVDAPSTRIGYEISFTRYFYKPQPLRTLDEIRADIEALERETDGLLSEILVETEAQ